MVISCKFNHVVVRRKTTKRQLYTDFFPNVCIARKVAYCMLFVTTAVKSRSTVLLAKISAVYWATVLRTPTTANFRHFHNAQKSTYPF